MPWSRGFSEPEGLTSGRILEASRWEEKQAAGRGPRPRVGCDVQLQLGSGTPVGQGCPDPPERGFWPGVPARPRCQSEGSRVKFRVTSRVLLSLPGEQSGPSLEAGLQVSGRRAAAPGVDPVGEGCWGAGEGLRRGSGDFPGTPLAFQGRR
ncbi:hypothetical protein HJG60_009431 [Phyllostomus discolor]|uniref:Uncharacterized protein n=1 Tax=Phyllostomus discolor TaxID=89673 RepID=A0A833YLA7_9CHIR|nr:hypothetical protein HJG60_009431 [Phyllostomus discolor]